MTVNRIEEIKRFFHLVDNDNPHEATDRFWKVRPLLEILHTTFYDAKLPTEMQSIDEMLIPFKGRSAMKQSEQTKEVGIPSLDSF